MCRACFVALEDNKPQGCGKLSALPQKRGFAARLI